MVLNRFSAHDQISQRIKLWVVPRRFKRVLHVFNVTIAFVMCLSVA